MARRNLAAFVVFLLSSAAFADDAGLRKIMPKDQLAVVEKLEESKVLRENAPKEKNGLKQKEMIDKAFKNQRDVAANLNKMIPKDGFKKWVGVVDTKVDRGDFAGKAMRIYVPGLGRKGSIPHYGLVVYVTYDTMPENMRKIVRELKAGDAIYLTATPPPKRFDGFGVSDDGVTAALQGSSVEEIQKIASSK